MGILEKLRLHRPRDRSTLRKRRLIDVAFERNPRIDSFADLGGVWGVNGGYSWYLLDRHPVAAAFLVDDHFSDEARGRAKRYPQMQLVLGDFRQARLYDELPDLDLILLFDVLLHQHNWRDVVSWCAAKARFLAIHNPQFPGLESYRLTELEEAEYFALVPHDRHETPYRDLFARSDRDTPAVWQWAITDSDLLGTLNQLGFEPVFEEEAEPQRGARYRGKGLLLEKVRS